MFKEATMRRRCGRTITDVVRVVAVRTALLALCASPCLLPGCASGGAKPKAHASPKAERPAKVDGAVARALEFLAKDHAAKRPDDALFSGKHGRTNAVAGLVGMAFLSNGYVPRDGRYSEVIRSCIDYVLTPHAKNGYLGARGGRMYGHGIATLFLLEASGMVDPERQKKIDAVLPKALKVILDAQKVPKREKMYRGGWRYDKDASDSDISVTGWQLRALLSAQLKGFSVPAESIRDAVAFIESSVRKDDGGFTYQPWADWWYRRRGYWVRNPSRPSTTGVGILCRELTGHHADAINLRAGDYLLKSIKGKFLDPGQIEYATYYCSQAMFQLGGKYWDEFAPAMYKYLLPRQQASGSWRTGRGEVYPTAMYVLSLTASLPKNPSGRGTKGGMGASRGRAGGRPGREGDTARGTNIVGSTTTGSKSQTVRTRRCSG